MKLGVVRRILKDDLRGGEKPGWLDPLLSTLNQFLEQTYVALNGNLTFGDNIASVQITQEFSHGTETVVNPNNSRTVGGVIVIDSGNEMVTGWMLSRKADGRVGITLKFDNGPGTTSTCKVELLLR